MKCKHYQKWLHLNRDGELTSRQSAKLERHLRHCRSCADEKSGIERVDRFIHAAGTVVSVPSEPQVLTRRIMAAVERSDRNAVVPRFEKGVSRWFDWFYVPRVRFALTGVVVLLLGVFIFQGTMILHRLHRLEQKMARRTGTPVSTDTLLSTRTTRARVALILEQADRVYDNLPDDDEPVVIRKGTLRRLLRWLIKSRRGDERVIEELLRRPDISGELKKILETKKDILNKMYRL